MKRAAVPAYFAAAGLVVGLAAMPLSAAPAPQAGWGDAAKFTTTRENDVDHVADKPLNVTTDNGAIKILKGSGDKVHIVAKVRATTQERLDQTKVATTREPDGTLKVVVQWPGTRKASEGCDIEVQTPGADGVTATTSNGSISATGLSGVAVLGSSNGSITVDAWEGDLKATTSNGSIDATAVAGKVHAASSNGRVRATNVAGPVTIETSNASVDVALKPKSAGPVTIETDNGTVHLKVGPAFIGKVHAQTSNGKVTVTGANAKPVGKPSRDEGTWQFGEGGKESEIETDNGSITVEVVESGG